MHDKRYGYKPQSKNTQLKRRLNDITKTKTKLKGHTTKPYSRDIHSPP